MIKYLIILVCIVCSVAQKSSSDWVKLFNDKDLTGWQLANNAQSEIKGVNGNAEFVVKDKEIIGTTAKKGVPNSFLSTVKKYQNYELKFAVKLQTPLNSGVQVRSISDKDKNRYRFHGPQVEVADSPYAGYIYGEAIDNGRKGYWLTSDKNKSKHNFFKKNEWNFYHIKVINNTIETTINGNFITKLTSDKIPLTGFIGLQVHSINGGGPYTVRWKNILLKELP